MPCAQAEPGHSKISDRGRIYRSVRVHGSTPWGTAGSRLRLVWFGRGFGWPAKTDLLLPSCQLCLVRSGSFQGPDHFGLKGQPPLLVGVGGVTVDVLPSPFA